MTTPKEALEQIAARSIAQNDDDAKELRRQLYHIASLAKSALASLEGDAVERVAQLIEDHVTAHCDDERCQTWIDNARDAAEAILATGLVAGEAAIRAAAFEEAAKIAESDELHDQWPLHGSEMQAPSKRMQIAIAAAIRSQEAGR